MSKFKVIVNKDFNEKNDPTALNEFIANNKTKLVEYNEREYDSDHEEYVEEIYDGYKAKVSADTLITLLNSELLLKIHDDTEYLVSEGNLELIETLDKTGNLPFFDQYEFEGYMKIALRLKDKRIWDFFLRKTKDDLDFYDVFDIISPSPDNSPIDTNATYDSYLDQFIELLKISNKAKILKDRTHILSRFGTYNNLKMLQTYLEYLKDQSIDYTQYIVMYILQNKLEFADVILKYATVFNTLDMSIFFNANAKEPEIESLIFLHELYANNVIKLSYRCLASIMLSFKKKYAVAFTYFLEAFPHVVYYIARSSENYSDADIFMDIYTKDLELCESMK